jgi:hypothetical protein
MIESVPDMSSMSTCVVCSFSVRVVERDVGVMVGGAVVVGGSAAGVGEEEEDILASWVKDGRVSLRECGARRRGRVRRRCMGVQNRT